ncbi:MAG: T9SS type A sorting domain-containing protein [Bacteroidia bacterium]|nr:T9SS type A sorting domain-containing protein [Bacteroidia bacterium]
MDTSYCKNDSSSIPYLLVGFPGGGTFSGPDVTGNEFNPLTSGIHIVTYTFTDIHGCSGSQSQSTIVYDRPIVTFIGLDTMYCENANPSTLMGNPAGGIFTGAGLTGNNFSPSNAGTGTHTIDYAYTDQHGCSAYKERNVTIHPLPAVSFSGLDSVYCKNNNPVYLTGDPVTGIFSGTGITDNYFYPMNVGAYPITFSYTDIHGCANSISKTATVNDLPLVSFIGLDSSYCINSNSEALTGTPQGGTFTGGGIINGNEFDPATAGIGYHTIIYVCTDINNCTSGDTGATNVRALPNVNFSGLDTAYCINNQPVVLSGNPPGGSFIGSGITGNIFSPSNPGINNITYVFTDNYNCSNSDIKNAVVYNLPAVSFSGMDTSYCLYAQADTLTGIPSGGSFIGSGIINNIFDPATAGTGIHLITYSFTDLHGCSNTISETTTVHSIPVVNFIGLDTSYCNIHNSITLTGLPQGGTFSGDGVTGSVFDPFDATLGIHIINYTFTDSYGCTGSYSLQTSVHEIPVVDFIGLDSSYCNDAQPVVLSGSPAGGTFSGAGINNQIFYPDSVSPGTYQITYSYTNAFGCENHIQHNVTLFGIPSVGFGGLVSDYCINAPADTLMGIPASGIFSGNGISENIFTPSNAMINQNTIIYTFTDTNNCTNSSMQVTAVHSLPQVSFSGLDTIYCISSVSAILTGAPSGGFFTGGNMTGTIFNPQTAGIGIHIIVYSYADSYGCRGYDTMQTAVYNNPSVSFSGLGDSYCQNAPPVVLSGIPSGGIFTGNGISGNLFKPETTVPGIYTITYTYTDIHGCSDSSSHATAVQEIPDFAFSSDTIKVNLPYALFADTGYASYLWQNGYTGRILIVTTAGMYSVTVTGYNGCSVSDSIFVVKANDVNDEEDKTQIAVYPNPANNFITISIESDIPEKLKIEITDSRGALVKSEEFKSAVRHCKTLDVSDLSKGIYYLKISANRKTAVIKVIIF